MTELMKRLDGVTLSIASERASFQPLGLREMYAWLVDRWQQVGLPPQRVDINCDGIPKSSQMRDFMRLGRKIEQADFGTLKSLALDHMLPGWKRAGEWATTFWARKDRKDATRWHCVWSIVPTAAGLSESEALAHLLEFGRLIAGEYGYVFFMRQGQGAEWYANGVNFGERSERTDDERMNVSWWNDKLDKKDVLLRDVYPLNLLTRPYLDLPVGGTTLERWITSDATRGTMAPLPGREDVAVWRPVAENVPALREQLFCAGVLFYWRFFDPSDPLFRDFGKPFVPPDPLPAIFRAEFYAGHDPELTR